VADIDFFIRKFRDLMDLAPRPSDYNLPRPYRNAVVRLRNCSIEDFKSRAELVYKAGLNVFLFPSEHIPGCDLLSDSGTTTMTMEQWSQLLLGDEAYGSNDGYFELLDQVTATFGEAWVEEGSRRRDDPSRPCVFVFHQGRAAEHALFNVLRAILRQTGENATPQPLPGELDEKLKARINKQIEDVKWQNQKIAEDIKKNRRDSTRPSLWMPARGGAPVSGGSPHFIIPSNSHFDTTEANIGSNNLVPLNIPCEQDSDDVEGAKANLFKGDMNVDYLGQLLELIPDRIPLVYLTITNNTGGGQPVSMQNIEQVTAMAHKKGIPVLFDACRFAENAWFIKQRDEKYKDKSIIYIVQEMFRHVDGFHISFKKDGLVNIGGGLAIKQGSMLDEAYPRLREMLTDHQILIEGHPTYGGLAGRDLKGIVEGLKTVVNQKYLAHRVLQVERFGKKINECGVTIRTPPGGHAIYIDMDDVFPKLPPEQEDFKSISFTALMLIAGHRLGELGLYAFGKYRYEKEEPPDPRVNYVRAAVPRLTYEDQDLFATAEAIKILYEHRDRIPGVTVTYGQDLLLRHFKSRFRLKE
jgi:tryptophanase